VLTKADSLSQKELKESIALVQVRAVKEPLDSRWNKPIALVQVRDPSHSLLLAFHPARAGAFP
jgi:hypothetical protein